jgi:hypothetical protein
MTAKSFHTGVRQVFDLDKAVDLAELKIEELIKHFKLIALIDGSHPYDDLTSEDHAEAPDLYDALEIHEASLRAYSVLREVLLLT